MNNYGLVPRVESQTTVYPNLVNSMSDSNFDRYMRYLEGQADYSRPSGDVSSALGSLVSNYNAAFAQAKAANEQRYQQMLSLVDTTTGQRAADIRSDYAKQGSDMMQKLARLGMGNTTVGSSLKSGIERNKQSALNTLADQLQGTKLDVLKSKEDEYPDTSALQSIIAGVGSAYSGGSGIVPMLQALASMRY